MKDGNFRLQIDNRWGLCFLVWETLKAFPGWPTLAHEAGVPSGYISKDGTALIALKVGHKSLMARQRAATAVLISGSIC